MKIVVEKGDGTPEGSPHVTGLTHFIVAAGCGSLINHANTFRALANAGVSVDMISVTPEKCSFVVAGEQADQAEGVLQLLGLSTRVLRGCAKLSFTDTGVLAQPGIMADVSETLQVAGVEIIQAADSDMTVSCLLRGADLARAEQALHQRFVPERGC